MHARLEGLSRAVTWLNDRATPAAMQRLNRYLVLHHPVLWRSRLLWVAWWSVLLSVVLGGIGYWTARSATSIWATEELASLLLFIRYTSAVLAIAWAVIHLRVALGEIPLGRHVSAAAANLLVILLMFLPGHVLGVAAGYAGAQLLTAGELVDARRGLEELERCATSANHDPRIASMLHHMRLRQRVAVDIANCDSFRVWQSFEPLLDNSQLQRDDGTHLGSWARIRVDSIATSRQFWNDGEGSLYDQCVRTWPWEVLAALCGAIFLALLGYPASAWRRRLGISARFGSSWAPPMPRLALLERFDQRLLTSYPLIWAARLHYLLPLVLAVIAGAVVVDLVDDVFSLRLIWIVSQWAAVLSIGLWPFAWQIARRADIGQVLPKRWQAVTAVSLAAVLCVPLLMLSLSPLVKTLEPRAVAFAGGALGLWTVGYVLVRAYKTRFQTFLFEAVALCCTLVLALLAGNVVEIARAVTAAFAAAGLAFWLTERANRSAAGTRRRSGLAAMCVLMFPALLVSMGSVVQVGEPQASGNRLTLLMAYPFRTCAILSAFLYLLALRPFVRALALAERAPKSD